MTPQTILDFWFSPDARTKWFAKDAAFDAAIRQRFGDLWQAAARAELSGWRSSPEGRLAEIVVLDQFSRNLWRDSPIAFAQDGMALVLAQEAVAGAHLVPLDVPRRAFVLMPFMHSESLAVHDRAVPLFEDLGEESFLSSEMQHRKVIERFGRYPQRNRVLGRTSTPEESKFLQETRPF